MHIDRERDFFLVCDDNQIWKFGLFLRIAFCITNRDVLITSRNKIEANAEKLYFGLTFGQLTTSYIELTLTTYIQICGQLFGGKSS